MCPSFIYVFANAFILIRNRKGIMNVLNHSLRFHPSTHKLLLPFEKV